MERADVIVVGGGPAGSSLAWGLRGSGLRVLLLDRQVFPRDKTCAGWVTPAVFESLGVDPDVYAKQRVLQPIHGFEVRRCGDRPAPVVRHAEVVSYGIRRSEFDHFLLARCEADLRVGVGFTGLEREGDTLIVNDRFAAPVVVGAGGHFCPIARRLATGPRSAEPIVAAQEIEFRLRAGETCPVDPELPELYFTADLKGYGWVFRKGDWLNVGLGRQDKHELSDHVEAFVDHLRALGRLPRTVPDERRGHAYLLRDQAPRRLVDDGIALVGDAAGLAYPRSGEGIRPAVESGLLLARALRETAPGRAHAARALARYERDLLARLGPRQARAGFGDVLPQALLRPLAGWLMGRSAFASRVVIDRWFLHRKLPVL